VGTSDELLSACRRAASGDVVYVQDDAVIDLTDRSNIPIDDGVTLASGRGVNGSPGALFYTDGLARPLFAVNGTKARVTGLRIRGPHTGYFDPERIGANAAEGIHLVGMDPKVDNCQLFGWPHAAVSVGTQTQPVSARIAHCSVHHNAMAGLGYGINLYNGHSIIEHNFFTRNRHSIAGFGYPTTGYEARYNLVDETVSHSFDMHGLSENIDVEDSVDDEVGLSNVTGSDGVTTEGTVAGGRICIERNTFRFTHDILGRPQEAITIRGVPTGSVQVLSNWFFHDTEPNSTDIGSNGQAYRQTNVPGDDWTNFLASENRFGTEPPPSEIGAPR